MSMKRSPAWYAEYQARRIKQIGKDSMSGVQTGILSGAQAGTTVKSPTLAGREDRALAEATSGPLTNIEFIGDGAIRKDAHEGTFRRRSQAQERGISPPIYPLVGLCRGAGLPEPIPEYPFHPTRKWRFDYCWPTYKLALEVDGGVWTQGRHTRGSGRVADMEKQSEAAILGYRILYVTPEQVSNGAALDYVQRALRPLEFVA